jgi:hypothetical protein
MKRADTAARAPLQPLVRPNACGPSRARRTGRPAPLAPQISSATRYGGGLAPLRRHEFCRPSLLLSPRLSRFCIAVSLVLATPVATDKRRDSCPRHARLRSARLPCLRPHTASQRPHPADLPASGARSRPRHSATSRPRHIGAGVRPNDQVQRARATALDGPTNFAARAPLQPLVMRAVANNHFHSRAVGYAS